MPVQATFIADAYRARWSALSASDRGGVQSEVF